MDIEAKLIEANARGLAPPQNWTQLAVDEIQRLRLALKFYADPTRYHGPNQALEEPDFWSESVGLKSYRLDVTRDGGMIARKALKDQP